MVDLKPHFRALIYQRLDEILKPINDNDGDTYGGYDVGSVWRDMQELLEVVVDMSGLTGGSDSALELFQQAFHEVIPHLWPESAVDDSELYMVPDETLLCVFKNLVKEQGVTGLQLWRKRLAREKVRPRHRELFAFAAFVPRAMQYATVVTTNAVTKVVTGKVCEGRLPWELTDMVFSNVLQARDVAIGDDNPSIWTPLAWCDAEPDPWSEDNGMQEQEEGQRCTCHLSACLNDAKGSAWYWSTSKRKYLRFHQFWESDLSDGGFKLDDFSLPDGYEREQPHAYMLLCGAQFSTRRVVNTRLVQEGPTPPVALIYRHRLFESDNGVERAWCVSQRTAGKYFGDGAQGI